MPSVDSLVDFWESRLRHGSMASLGSFSVSMPVLPVVPVVPVLPTLPTLQTTNPILGDSDRRTLIQKKERSRSFITICKPVFFG